MGIFAPTDNSFVIIALHTVTNWEVLTLQIY